VLAALDAPGDAAQDLGPASDHAEG
jgi:hypothetical protein